MRSAVNALRALLRVELRELRRHRARTWLVLALLALPVAGMVAGATLLAITEPTPAERRANALGRADLRVDRREAENLERAEEILVRARRTERLHREVERWTLGGRAVRVRICAAPSRAYAEGGLAHGLIQIRAGRAPERENELALSPVLLAEADIALEGQLALEGVSWRVVGVAIDPEDLEARLALRAPVGVGTARASSLLCELGSKLRLEERRALSEAGYTVLEAGSLGGPDGLHSALVFLAGGFALGEAALVIAAAFAVSLRRRQRELGLLGASGAAPRDLLRAILTSTALLALVGGGLGALLGVSVAALLHPHLDAWNRRLNGPFELDPRVLALAGAIALLAALLAVAWPAWRTVRLPIREALGARRPPLAPSRRAFCFGLVLLLLGGAMVLLCSRVEESTSATLALAGSLTAVLGLAFATPGILAFLARGAASLPLVWRIAVRDAARFRARNAAVVLAIFAALSVSVMIAMVYGSVRELRRGVVSMRDDQLLLVGKFATEVSAEVGAVLGATQVVRVRPLEAQVALRSSDGGKSKVLGHLGDAVALLDPALVEALQLALDPPLDPARPLVLLGPEAFASASSAHARVLLRRRDGEEVELPEPRLVPVPWTNVALPVALVPESLAATQGFSSARSAPSALLVFPRPLAIADLQLALATCARSGVSAHYALDLEPGDAALEVRLLLIACLVTSLLVLLAATSLTQVESASDARVLHEVGAAPRVLRGIAGARAAYLALLGALLALPAGLLPAFGILSLAQRELGLSASSLRELGSFALLLPVLAYASAWLLAPRTIPYRRAAAPSGP